MSGRKPIGTTVAVDATTPGPARRAKRDKVPAGERQRVRAVAPGECRAWAVDACRLQAPAQPPPAWRALVGGAVVTPLASLSSLRVILSACDAALMVSFLANHVLGDVPSPPGITEPGRFGMLQLSPLRRQGCFLDGISMVVLTMGVILPTLQKAGIDRLWFGIFTVQVVEMAQITPPVGFNLLVLQGRTKREIGWIAKVTLPFFFLMIGAVALIWFVPQIITFLPQQMRG
ncbi:hypothetical protein DBR42_29120 [Pelomonas sp. HMWF004]|nr:hypothetical protein DBR42_29120 [Pelomonas sp. HMWF004]